MWRSPECVYIGLPDERLDASSLGYRNTKKKVSNHIVTGSFSAFGHQHVGLTGGPKIGWIIADLIERKEPNIDLAPFDPKKYKT